LSSYTPLSPNTSIAELPAVLPSRWNWFKTLRWQILITAIFLISVPVFFQAPLVRNLPGISLGLTIGWLGCSGLLLAQDRTRTWGDLLLGFAWTWLCGSLYWGWFRWEPLLHLPLEASALPIVLWLLWKGQAKIGSWFYLGSLLGTALTDAYFYLMGLIPHWRQLMQDPEMATVIFQDALAKVHTPSGGGIALILAIVLILGGTQPLRSSHAHYWAFGGAVLSTLLVDGLFWLIAATC
jgi:Protein of unknown function (DUF3120)